MGQARLLTFITNSNRKLRLGNDYKLNYFLGTTVGRSDFHMVTRIDAL